MTIANRPAVGSTNGLVASQHAACVNELVYTILPLRAFTDGSTIEAYAHDDVVTQHAAMDGLV